MKNDNSKTNILAPSNNHRKYGFLSMFSMVVGIVIGSGIFFKNQILYEQSQSIFMVMIGWFLVAAIVLFMIVGFVEIASASKRRKEQGTLSNWGTYFLGKGMGKFIGYFFSYFYFPIMFATVTLVFSQQIISGIAQTNPGFLSNMTSMTYFWIMTIIGFALVLVVVLINTFTSKPGKILQISGTGIKLFPLLLVSIGFFFVLSSSANVQQNFEQMWNANNEIYNSGMQDQTTGSLVKILIVMLPGIMFSFDGFCLAASVQTEAKKPSTFKTALVFGMIFVILIYILTTMAVFAVVPPGEVYDVPTAIAAMFPAQAYWLPLFVSVTIAISILTSISGLAISSSRNLAGLSEKNYIADTNGKYLKRNAALVPQKAALRMLFITLAWMVVTRIMDWIVISQSGLNPVNAAFHPFYFTDFLNSLAVVVAFVVYGLLLVGVVVNRFTKKVEVDKVKGAASLSIFSSLMILVISVFFLYDIFSYDPNSVYIYSTANIYITKISLTTFITVLVAGIYIFNWLRIKLIDKEVFKVKQDYINDYLSLKVTIGSTKRRQKTIKYHDNDKIIRY